MENEFSPYGKFSIGDADVIRADQLRNKMNSYLGIMQMQAAEYNGACISRTTPKVVRAKSTEIAKIVGNKRGESLSDFDRLVLDDCSTNALMATAYCDYMISPAKGNIYPTRGMKKAEKLTVGDFFGLFFGEGAYASILDGASKKNYPHDLVHKLYVALNEAHCRQISVEDMLAAERHSTMFKDAKKLLLGKLNHYKSLAEDFYRNMGVLNNLDRFKFEFCSPSMGFSYWDDPYMMVHLEPEKAIVYKKSPDGELVLQDIDIKTTSIHETGHGIHFKISESSMPKGLSPETESFLPCIHGSHAEGLALLTEDLWADYAKENRLLSNEDLILLRLDNEAYVPSKLHRIAHDILYQSYIENYNGKRHPETLKKDTDERVAELTGIKRYRSFSFDPRSLDETLQQATYFFGEKRIFSLAEEMKEAGLSPGEIITCLAHGSWCDPKAHKNFIFDVLLKRK